jgi:hypothetical protein
LPTPQSDDYTPPSDPPSSSENNSENDPPSDEEEKEPESSSVDQTEAIDIPLDENGISEYEYTQDNERDPLQDMRADLERQQEQRVAKDKELNDFANFEFRCYFCNDYRCNTIPCDKKCSRSYEEPVRNEHGLNLYYPTKADIEKLGLTPQGKPWET